MPNGAPRRPRQFIPYPQNGGPQSDAKDQRALASEGQAQAAAAQQQRDQSLTTASRRPVPSIQDAVEIQAYILRKEGWSYADVCRALDVGHDLARTLVAEGAKRCVDEDPITSLRLHLGRIEGLVQEWYTRAFVQEGAVRDPESGLLVEAEAHARANGEFLLKILGLQEKIGTWLAGLPRRGQERKEEDDHAEIKAILMRAEEYGPPPGQEGVPHGLPSLGWKPGDVEDE